MQTVFTPEQLRDPDIAASNQVLRTCVHCGFCTATCPTFLLLGDELDSPRGRIHLIKDMLQRSGVPSPHVVKHLDRCLSCLSCETHCPSGVSYRRIIDAGRAYVDRRYRRPLPDRALRALIAHLLPHPGRFRAVMHLAALVQPFAGWLEQAPLTRPLAAMLRLREVALARPRPAAHSPSAPSTKSSPAAPAARAEAPVLRVGVARGCVEPVLDPEIQAATARLLERAGCEIVRAPREGCCGGLSHHMGREAEARKLARANVDAWHRALTAGPLDAIVISASGCGPVVRDFAHLLREDAGYADKAAQVAALACDLSQVLERVALPPPARAVRTVVGYHAACSQQHGQRLGDAPARLLRAAGFEVRVPKDAHLCCGSAGVYNILEPAIAARLGANKAQALDALAADVIAGGNLGCLLQIGAASGLPVVHTAQLLDWATGGPRPAAMR